MSEMEPWTRHLLSVIVSQLCKTIGWNSISSTSLQVLVDVLHRYLKQMSSGMRDYTDHFNHTFPALEEIDLVFNDMGINVEDLKEYANYVKPITIKHRVPKYPLEKKSNLNFLKPGSREVVTRPVHIHEYLPAMYPEMSDENYPSQENLNSENPSDPGGSGSKYQKSTKKEVLNNKHLTRLTSQEVGRPLRELGCIMMTTSGFLSPAREGKGPEARLPKVPATDSAQPNQSASFPNVPPEVKGEHKKSHSKSSKTGDRKIREEQPAAKEEVADTKVKKLAGMKELSKLKAFKPILSKTADAVDGTRVSPKQEKSKASAPLPSPKEPKVAKAPKVEKPVESCPKEPKVAKSPKVEKLVEPAPKEPKVAKQIKVEKVAEPSVKEPKAAKPPKAEKAVEPKTPKLIKVEKLAEKVLPAEPEIVEEKLTTEPNKQKLNIFKRISKVKEERVDPPQPRNPISVRNPQTNDSLEVIVKRGYESNPAAVRERELEITLVPAIPQPPPATFIAPHPMDILTIETSHETILEAIPAARHSKRKKKQKNHGIQVSKRQKLVQEPMVYAEPEPEKPKQTEPEPPPEYPFFKQLQSGIMPPSLSSNLLIPRLNPFINITKSDPNCPHPEMPNLPLPPATLMQVSVESHNVAPLKVELEKTAVDEAGIVDKKQKKKMKKDKREKDKKKRQKKDKLLKKKEKLTKKKDLKKQQKLKKPKSKKPKASAPPAPEPAVAEDTSVPKLKLKIGGSSSPQLSPNDVKSPKPKIVIKPIVKQEEAPSGAEEPTAKEAPPLPSAELAKVAAIVGKPAKQKNSVKTAVPESSKSLAEAPPPPPPVLTISTKSGKKNASEVKTKNKDKGKSKKIEGSPKMEAYYYDALGNQVWVCPSCGAQDDGSPMIGCDGCDAWYHWVCVGIKSAPDSVKWFCSSCAKKKT